MKKYIGCKIITAEPMVESTFYLVEKDSNVIPKQDRDGYRVVYPDGYVSWSPKDVFETAYREVTPSEIQLIKS